MGAWDTTSFGNDTACDWLGELIQSGTPEMIDDALDAVLSTGDEPIDAATAEEAIAAAEVLAWLHGRSGPSGEESEGLDDWVDQQEVEEDGARIRRARRAIDRIFNHPCELLEVWEGSEEFEDWRKSIADLKGRLREA